MVAAALGRILYLRPGLDPPASVDGGVLPAPLYPEKKGRVNNKEKFLPVFFWEQKQAFLDLHNKKSYYYYVGMNPIKQNQLFGSNATEA